jgi:TPR repeat protein
MTLRLIKNSVVEASQDGKNWRSLYYQLAADQNHASTQRRYGLCLPNWRSLVKNNAEAARYCKLAANQNDASA